MRNKNKKKKGQVAVEYVLLLVVVVALATVFKTFINVGTAPDGTGASEFVQYWRKLIEAIALDVPHD